MRMKRLIEVMRRESNKGYHSSEKIDSETREWERIHIPTLITIFKNEIENEVDTEGKALTEDEGCNRCIQNYLVSLDKAVRAAKGNLIRK